MNNGAAAVIGAVIVFVMVLIFTYFVFVGLAWIILTAFSLSYNPWLVGLALMAIKMIISR